MARPLLRLIVLLTLLLPAGVIPARPSLAQVVFPQSSLEVIGADGGLHRFTVELAVTPQQLAQGLMYRPKMAADAGMLFDFGAPKPIAMWMKNTLIPLDMLFIDEKGVVTGIAQRTIPQSTVTIASPGAVKAVLEVNGGTVSRLHMQPGDRILHPLFANAAETR